MDERINLFDFEAAARESLSPMARDYYASGAHDEITLRDNHAMQRGLDAPAHRGGLDEGAVFGGAAVGAVAAVLVAGEVGEDPIGAHPCTFPRTFEPFTLRRLGGGSQPKSRAGAEGDEHGEGGAGEGALAREEGVAIDRDGAGRFEQGGEPSCGLLLFGRGGRVRVTIAAGGPGALDPQTSALEAAEEGDLYVFEREEAVLGFGCVAAPIGPAGHAVAAVSVCGPAHRLSFDQRLTAPVRMTAMGIWRTAQDGVPPTLQSLRPLRGVPAPRPTAALQLA